VQVPGSLSFLILLKYKTGYHRLFDIGRVIPGLRGFLPVSCYVMIWE